MSLHYHRPDYNCSRCQSVFIPYRVGIKCPNCGMAVKDADTTACLDTIDRIAGSMEIHKRENGTYLPGAWITMDFMDHMQGIIYRIFDSMEAEKPENEEQYLMKILNDKDMWGKDLYIKEHAKEITSEVFKIYKAKKFSEIKYSKPLPPTKWEKTKRWFEKFF